MGEAISRRKEKAVVLKQKKTMDMFLERNAISKAQYDKSLGDLIEKWGCRELHKEKAEDSCRGFCER